MSVKERVEQEMIIVRNIEQAGLLLPLTLLNPSTNPICTQLLAQKKAHLNRLVSNRLYIVDSTACHTTFKQETQVKSLQAILDQDLSSHDGSFVMSLEVA